MKLYRFVHKDELKKMLDGDVENLGNRFKNRELSNSHHYNDGKKYLHFFYNKEACQHIIDDVMFKDIKIDNKGSVKDFFICTFDIPFKLLIFRTGKGLYKSLDKPFKGYFQETRKRLEAAIPSKLFDKNWIISYEPAIFTKGVHKKEAEMDLNQKR